MEKSKIEFFKIDGEYHYVVVPDETRSKGPSWFAVVIVTLLIWPIGLCMAAYKLFKN